MIVINKGPRKAGGRVGGMQGDYLGYFPAVNPIIFCYAGCSATPLTPKSVLNGFLLVPSSVSYTAELIVRPCIRLAYVRTSIIEFALQVYYL